MGYTLEFANKQIIGKITVGLMIGAWKHATEGHYDGNNPNNQPDKSKSYYTIPKGSMPVGNDMALCIMNTCTGGVRVMHDGGTNANGQASIKVYREFPNVIGKTADGQDCKFSCVVLGYDKNVPFVFTAYPVKSIPPGTPLK